MLPFLGLEARTFAGLSSRREETPRTLCVSRVGRRWRGLERASGEVAGTPGPDSGVSQDAREVDAADGEWTQWTGGGRGGRGVDS